MLGPKSTEIAHEQQYFDRAQAAQQRRRAGAKHLADAAANRGAAAALRKHAEQDQRGEPNDQAVAFGRIDAEAGEVTYVGNRLIMGSDHQPMVINWQAPAATPYYVASHADSLGLTRKRSFECTANHIDDFTDVIFAAIAGAVAGPDAELLKELSKGRTGRMRDIVRTIQEAQFELIRAPMDQVLVIEGGPGTGKTAIALHRVSWLLFNHRDRVEAQDVLVVGPHPTFTAYISTVLPSLGDDQVSQLDISQLAPQVPRGRTESDQVRRIKGEARMAGLLDRALENRIGLAEAAERIQIDGRFVTVPGVEITDAVVKAQATDGSYVVRRLALRERLIAILEDRGVSGRPSVLDSLLNRLWPILTAPAVVRDLFSSQARLVAAMGDDFTEAEMTLLRRRAADRLSEESWTRDDLPLLDETEHLIHGTDRRFAHVVVDEVQDLSPMQLRSVARRSSTGSLTVVGDLAQSTGPWARDSWAEVTEHLPTTFPGSVVHLRYGYRVPRQIFGFAEPLLAVAAPGSVAPQVVRLGGGEPGVHRVDAAERAGRVASIAIAHAEQGRFVGIICPSPLRAAVEEALAANGSSWSSADRGELGRAINLVSPHETKGLEFDAVVVVEPAEIVAADPRGHRLLYVALTRATGFLDVVCVGDPLPLGQPEKRPSEVDALVAQSVGASQGDVLGLATQIAVMLRANAEQPRWAEVLRQVARQLSEDW